MDKVSHFKFSNTDLIKIDASPRLIKIQAENFSLMYEMEPGSGLLNLLCLGIRYGILG